MFKPLGLILDMDGSERIDHTGSRTTYMYQLEVFRAAVPEGRPFPTTTADSMATMELIGACYRAGRTEPKERGVMTYQGPV
jgi:hypothetical protein